jgi:CheY-like chemotaxis protein
MNAALQTRPSILVVDDEPGVRAALRLVLEHGGYSVTEAANGQEALDRFRSHSFEVVLIDLFMPEREGLETIASFKRQYPGLKIIAISGAFSGEFLEIAKHLGADKALPKPIRGADLLAAVRTLLS